MAMYNCNRCDRLLDADDGFCYPDPNDETKLICDNCCSKMQDEDHIAETNNLKELPNGR